MKTSHKLIKFFSKPAMELFPILTLLSIVLSFMLPPCANSQQILVKSPKEQDHHEFQLALPRKLRLVEEANVKAVETRNHVLQNKQEKALTGKFHQKEADLVHAKKGTWQEWKDGDDSAQFFSMDYTHVRRRRPIHNKFTSATAP